MFESYKKYAEVWVEDSRNVRPHTAPVIRGNPLSGDLENCEFDAREEER